MKNKKILIVIIAILLMNLVYIYQNFIFFGTLPTTQIDRMGIIDGNITSEYSNSIHYYGNKSDEENSHGESLIDYLKHRGYNGEIYYYSAEDENGGISSNSIISGLNWLKDNDITKINISLSSKYKSEELEEWIINNPQITIFCSYNNQINSLDYPAMMNGTIASGCSNKINYKNNDKKYKTSKLIIWNEGLHYYNGNSYLSLETLLNYKE